MSAPAMQPPEAVTKAAATHVHRMAGPRGAFPGLTAIARERLALLAPHRMFTLGLDALERRSLDSAVASGWRYLVADGDDVVASAEVGDDAGDAPMVNAGPYVGATTEAIDELEESSEVGELEFELRLLKVPALYVAAAWLEGDRRLVVPLAPAPSFLEAGRVYPEAEFFDALAIGARQIDGAAEDSGG